jgi:hypothetical protein
MSAHTPVSYHHQISYHIYNRNPLRNIHLTHQRVYNNDEETGSQRSPAKAGVKRFTISYMIQNEKGETVQLRQKKIMTLFKPHILKIGETLIASSFPK